MPITQTETRWAPIDRFPDYEVSDAGTVRRTTPGPKTFPGKVSKPHESPTGYLEVSLSRRIRGRSRVQRVPVHRLVALAFLPNPEGKPQVAHRDGNKMDARLSNLRWSTAAENDADKDAHGTRLVGSAHGRAVLNWGQALRALLDVEVSDADYARRYRVTRPTISAIRRRVTWKCLPDFRELETYYPSELSS